MDEILWTPHGESKADMDLKEGSSKNRREGQLCAYSLCTNGSGGGGGGVIKEKKKIVKWFGT